MPGSAIVWALTQIVPIGNLGIVRGARTQERVPEETARWHERVARLVGADLFFRCHGATHVPDFVPKSPFRPRDACFHGRHGDERRILQRTLAGCRARRGGVN